MNEQEFSKPCAALQRLEVFVGKWMLEGEQLESPVGPAAKITGEERFEWLPGNCFLIHHFNGRVGETDACCIEITGHSDQDDSYPTYTFYNDGVAHRWHLNERPSGWEFKGDWPMHGQSMKVRCTIRFDETGDRRTSTWQYSPDGSSWISFWEVRATRAAGMAKAAAG